MNTSVIISEVKKVADYLIAQGMYNDPESAFNAALRVVQIEIDILAKGRDIAGSLRFLDQIVSEITNRQDV